MTGDHWHIIDTFPSITPAEVLKLINMSSNKSYWMDFIPTSLIKSFSTVFSEIISNLANLSISQGYFPLKFKLAQVTPLLKKVDLDKNAPSNYRRISNLNNISKLLEHLILSRIQHYTTSSCNLNPFQSVYRRYYSTESALFLALDNTISTILLTRAHRRCWYRWILPLHYTPSITPFYLVDYKPASAYLDLPLHGSTPILRGAVNLSVLNVPRLQLLCASRAFWKDLSSVLCFFLYSSHPLHILSVHMVSCSRYGLLQQ